MAASTDHLGSPPNTDSERQLIIELMRSPEVKFKSIIENHYTTSSDKGRFLNRLDEIFTFYYNTNYSDGSVQPFMLRPKALTLGFEIILELKGSLLKSDFTHREYAIAHEFKVKAGLAKALSREDQRGEGGKRREKAFDSLNPKSKSATNPFKEPTSEELKSAIRLLNDYPNAKALAEKTLREKE